MFYLTMIKIFKILILSLCFIANLKAAASLTAQELKAINEKGLVTKATRIKGITWPKLEIKTLIKASPLSAMAIFAAYDYQKNYVPNMMESSIDKVVSPTQIHVRYKLKMPWPMSPGEYVNAHELSSEGPNHYFLRWEGVSSDSTDSVHGSAEFMTYDKDPTMTVLIYKSRVVPKSFFAGIIRKFMIRDVENFIKILVKTTQDLKVQKSKILIEYEGKIIQALKGTIPYKTK